MIIIDRKIEESIVINNQEIRVMITAVDRNQVKIGIEAPKNIAILRQEVKKRMQDRLRFQD